ncbi:MAG: low-specificity L-threonine aldolase [Chloroflexi bacterium]|nr:MAG: low-specificity L-threonine aldolase [Chloroflexota bacterium]
MDKIDFRSDTVTWPTPAMREAMARAQVGDDVYGEDPTVNELEALAAAKTGKEAGLFVASGTMGNLTAILTHAGRGDQAIVGEDAHTYRYEAGGMAALGGIMPCPLPTDETGQMDVAAVESAVSPNDPHFPHTRLILLENSYGAKNGYPLPPTYFQAIRTVAERHQLSIHLDGARLFNAAVAQNIPVTEITRHVDSVSFCLSKGLCAPVGSVLCGTAEFIQRARRIRKILGGGMRQAGVLAAAGIIALNSMIERLSDDHTNARILAEGLARIPGIIIQPERVKTNIIFFELAAEVPMTADEVVNTLRQKANIWLSATNSRQFRAVTHYWVGQPEVNLLLETLAEILR